MTERMIVRQNNRFETEFLSIDPHQPESQEFMPVESIHDLTPYGMLLAGIAGCTAIVLHTYAQNHGLDLREVELRLVYDRVFKEDCENCEGIDRYTERIEEEIILVGELEERERERLFSVSKQCPIHKMIEDGTEIHSELISKPEAMAR